MNSSFADPESSSLLNDGRNIDAIRAPRISFLIPYFGRWPFWMPLFLESCRYNPDIDWLFFSDCDVPANLPTNVRIQCIAYADYCALVSERLDIDFRPENPYKLCDLRPALGYIHEESLANCDFWAFGDIDIIYGRLRKFFNNQRLQRYDLISNHARRISGHLCLIRNTPRMNNLFKIIPDWQQRFCGPHQALDEGAFSRLFLWRKNFPMPLFKFVGLFNPLRRKSIFLEAYSTPNASIRWTDGSKNFPLRWFWRKGRLTNDKDGQREFPYLHFMVWKNEWRSQPDPTPETIRQLVQQHNWQINAQGFGEIV
ncbi:MAG: hypothetical protein LBP58_03930 [Azoarcus sp.]|jgi:hypothetical protein|nr:hypothetical protein [Azoarcus sp.]